ncbi:MAG: rRNA maturation RNase YbeY [Bacteroidota bacterium]
MSIQFHNADRSFSLKNRRKLKAFIANLIKKEGFEAGDLSFISCSDPFLLDINRQFLRHDTYTDIITFPFSVAGQPISGEIYISIDRVRENATLFQTNTVLELHRVIFHGTLHLCGYQDKTSPQKKIMREKENQALVAYFPDLTFHVEHKL